MTSKNYPDLRGIGQTPVLQHGSLMGMRDIRYGKLRKNVNRAVIAAQKKT